MGTRFDGCVSGAEGVLNRVGWLCAVRLVDYSRRGRCRGEFRRSSWGNGRSAFTCVFKRMTGLGRGTLGVSSKCGSKASGDLFFCCVEAYGGEVCSRCLFWLLVSLPMVGCVGPAVEVSNVASCRDGGAMLLGDLLWRWGVLFHCR